MLAKLKTALSFAPRVEFLHYEDGLLTVRCKKALSFARTSVKFETSMGTVLAQVLVESYDAANDVYRVKVLERTSSRNDIAVERRESLRMPKVLRVTSQYIPGFTGVTEDISITGVRIGTRGQLPVEREIPLVLELDDELAPAIALKVYVAWTAKKGDGMYQSGLRFVDLEGSSQQLIHKYVKSRQAIEKRLHTLEEVDPFEVM